MPMLVLIPHFRYPPYGRQEARPKCHMPRINSSNTMRIPRRKGQLICLQGTAIGGTVHIFNQG